MTLSSTSFDTKIFDSWGGPVLTLRDAYWPLFHLATTTELLYQIHDNFQKVNQLTHIRLIPQGTVDNNLGPDRLAGQKALDPNYSRQPTL